MAQHAASETEKHEAEVLKLQMQLDRALYNGNTAHSLEKKIAEQQTALLHAQNLADKLASELKSQEQRQQSVLDVSFFHCLLLLQLPLLIYNLWTWLGSSQKFCFSKPNSDRRNHNPPRATGDIRLFVIAHPLIVLNAV